MPFNGSGTFNRVYNWVNDANNSINITASRVDTEDTGFATGLSNCLCKDGQQVWGANQNAGANKITNLANGSASGDSAAVGQVMLLSGSQTMTGKLSLVAGTTTIAPIGFTSGTNLTAPVSGVMEYDGTHLYFTDSTPTRHTIAPQDSPVFTTPTLGVATATTINKVTFTAPATGSTLTIADGKTATINNSLTFAGTDSTTQTFQASDTIVGRATTDTLTNKTIAGGSNTLSAIALSSLASQNANTFVMNNTGGSASPTAVTVANTLTALGFTTSGIAANGTITLPGGLILKWGDAGSLGGGSTAAVTFGTAFPTNIWSVVLGAVTIGGNSGATMVQSPSTSGFTYYNPSGTTYSHTYWVSIGN